MATPTASPARPAPGVHVRLEVRVGNARPTLYEVGDGGFLIGSVPGCDLRLPGTNLPPVICLIARHANGASLRKLAPVQPVTVNGQAVSATYLADGDRVAIGQLEVSVSLDGVSAVPLADPVSREREVEAETATLIRERDEARAELLRRAREVETLRSRPTAPVTDASLREREEALGRQEQDLATLRREVVKTRRQLAERYQKRRERMLTQQQAIHRAARKVLERKRQIDFREAEIKAGEERLALRVAEIEAVGEQTERERGLVEEQYRLLASRQQEAQRDLSQRVADLERREKAVVEERAALEKGQRQHQGDLIRLDRIQANIEQRQKQLELRALETDRKFELMQREGRELLERGRQMEEWHARLTAEAERLEAQKGEQDAVASQVEQRSAALEGQQTMLTTLRTRLERMREELRRQEQALSDQRVMQEATEADLKARADEIERLQAEAANDRDLCAQERRRFDERKATMEQAVAQLRQAQEQAAAERQELDARRAELEEATADQQEQAATLLVRGHQLEEMHQRLQAEKQAVREREEALSRAEQTLQGLQEQVRRRSEDLGQRQKGVEGAEAEIDRLRAEAEARVQAREEQAREAAAQLDALRQELAARLEQQEMRAKEQERRDQELAGREHRLTEEVQAYQAQRQALSSERLAWEVDRQAAAEHHRVAREELAELREQTQGIVRQLPDLEQRAAASLERLTRARDQMREHLAEVHTYARQGRDDLEAARRGVQADLERSRQHELALEVARDEQRLAVAAFRQQLIEWQGKVGEMRQVLQVSSSQLEMRQADIDQQARQVADEEARLAAEAAELQRERQQVEVKRGEMDRHLGDMREWYRRKLRELSGVDAPPEDGDDFVPLPSAAGDERSPARAVLTMADEIAPADRDLGELLRSLELVDSDTMNALWAEARRQRRSLRQLLLAGGYLTLYQMALIEAGNLDGLVLGPVRVIDKLPSTPREAVYRVYDPRHNAECVLRHLGEAEMHDAVRPDEFRQRFQAAAQVQHPNVAAVLEVLEIAGRPAALVEYVSGLGSGDWPGLAAAPGAWYRLVCQAALAVHAAHEQGLCHGHLDPASFALSGVGEVKLQGLGEPAWLGAGGERDETPAADLAGLGRVIASWAAVPPTGKGGKSKPLPEELQGLAGRLQSGGIATAKALIEELEQVGVRVPASGAAWERLLKYVREQTAGGSLRQSA